MASTSLSEDEKLDSETRAWYHLISRAECNVFQFRSKSRHKKYVLPKSVSSVNKSFIKPFRSFTFFSEIAVFTLAVVNEHRVISENSLVANNSRCTQRTRHAAVSSRGSLPESSGKKKFGEYCSSLVVWLYLLIKLGSNSEVFDVLLPTERTLYKRN